MNNDKFKNSFYCFQEEYAKMLQEKRIRNEELKEALKDVDYSKIPKPEKFDFVICCDKIVVLNKKEN